MEYYTDSEHANRRNFLKTGVLGAGALSLLGGQLAAQAASAASINTNVELKYLRSPKKIVFINLFGAPDGLEHIVPYGDPSLAGLRKDITRAAPGKGSDATLKLDNFFGLCPRLPNLHRMYQSKEYLPIHAASVGHTNRSHFSASTMLQNGTFSEFFQQGWMGRAIDIISKRAQLSRAETKLLSILPAADTPVLLEGGAPTMEFGGNSKGGFSEAYYQKYLRNKPAIAGEDRDLLSLKNQILEGLDTRSTFDTLVNTAPNVALTKAALKKPTDPVQQAVVISQLFALKNGPRFATIKLTGFDTHRSQKIRANTAYGRTMATVDTIFATLKQNMGAEWRNCIVLAGGEFGRTCAVNGTGGTDHGIGGAWHVAGGAVNGGRVLADWPGLKTGDMVDGRYLRPTTSIVSIFKGILQDGFDLSNNDLNKIFPAHSNSRPTQGILRG